jgi:hypothetical protein
MWLWRMCGRLKFESGNDFTIDDTDVNATDSMGRSVTSGSSDSSAGRGSRRSLFHFQRHGLLSYDVYTGKERYLVLSLDLAGDLVSNAPTWNVHCLPWQKDNASTDPRPGRSVIYTHRGTYSCDHHSTFWCQVRLRKPKPSFGILRLFLRHKVTNENVHIRSHSIFREPRMYSRNRYLDHLTTLFPDTLAGDRVYSVENFIYR